MPLSSNQCLLKLYFWGNSSFYPLKCVFWNISHNKNQRKKTFYSLSFFTQFWFHTEKWGENYSQFCNFFKSHKNCLHTSFRALTKLFGENQKNQPEKCASNFFGLHVQLGRKGLWDMLQSFFRFWGFCGVFPRNWWFRLNFEECRNKHISWLTTGEDSMSNLDWFEGEWSEKLVKKAVRKARFW